MLNFIINNSPLLYFTQSLWRDEVFSIFVAQRPILSFIGNLSFEPPFYYMILHFWMKIFGTSEIATRSLSFIAFMLATILVIFHAEKRFKKHWLAWYSPIFFFFNPMLLYYAFEVRTYGWFIFFATASFITYMEKKWKWYIWATTLGFYTHAYMIIVPFVQCVHYVVVNWKQFKKMNLIKIADDQMIKSLITFFILISPWLVIIVRDISKLKQSWYFPVDVQLVRSVVGNMFVGFEGTPWFGWKYTSMLSAILIFLFAYALRDSKNRKINLYYFLMIFVPLTVVVGISFIKPLFVNRYLIPVTIAQVFLLLGVIQGMSNRWFQMAFATLAFLFVLFVNVWYPKYHSKTPSRTAMYQINSLWDSDDVVFASSPLVLFEAQYYSSDPKRVFLYNPSGSPFPWFVGDFIVESKQITDTIPYFPSRAFFIHDDATFEIRYKILTPERQNSDSIKL